MNHDKNIYLITNIAPHYRRDVWRGLSSIKGLNFHFVFGQSEGANKIRSFNYDDLVQKNLVTRVQNIYFKNVLVWQCWTPLLVLNRRIDTVILLGDMNIVSNWLVAILCRLSNTHIIFWGHGFNGSERCLKRIVRICFNKLAHAHLIYGNRAKDIMLELGFKPDELRVVYNSLPREERIEEMRIKSLAEPRERVMNFFTNPRLPIIMFIGRITKVKRLDLLLTAIQNLNSISVQFNCLIVGNGSELAELKYQHQNDISRSYLHFYGDSYDEMVNAAFIANSDLCVGPGNIGLTAIHSMTYGTPCLTHDNFAKQMPEFEAIIDGETGTFFKEGNAGSLADSVYNWFNRQNYNRDSIRLKCYGIVDNQYNTENQIAIIGSLLKGL